MDSRRRTLATSGTSSLPVPSSAAKSSLIGRASLAPSRSVNLAAPSQQHHRPSHAHAHAHAHGHGHSQYGEPPSTVNRASLYASTQTNSVSRSMGALRGASLGRGGGGGGGQGAAEQGGPLPGGQEYAPPSARRSSMARRQTLTAISTHPLLAVPMTSSSGGLNNNNGMSMGGAGAGAGKERKDPRAKNTTEFKRRAAEEIAEVCSARGFAVEFKTLLQPTSKDFAAIFRFLVAQKEPNYKFGLGGKKFEDEVVPLLKLLGYPWAGDISKSHLGAVGSSYAWPHFLAMLHWLAQVVKVCDEAFIESVQLHMPPPLEEWIDQPGPTTSLFAWLDYLRASYPKFLASEDFDVEEELDVLGQRANSDEQGLRESLRGHEEEHKGLREELEVLLSQPSPLEQVQQDLGRLERDSKKMEEYLSSIRSKTSLSHEQTRKFRHAIEGDTRSLREKVDFGHELQRRIAEQGLSPAEIQGMTEQKSKLQAQWEAVMKRQEHANAKSLGLEVDMQKKIDRSLKHSGRYEEKARTLGLVPHPPAGYEHLDFTQDLADLSGPALASRGIPELQGKIKPALVELRQREKEEVRRIRAATIEAEREVGVRDEGATDLKDRLGLEQAKLDSALRSKEDLVEATRAEFGNGDATVARLDETVRSTSATMRLALSNAEWRLQQRRAERTQVESDTTALKAEAHKALEGRIQVAVDYKEQMTKIVGEIHETASRAREVKEE